MTSKTTWTISIMTRLTEAEHNEIHKMLREPTSRYKSWADEWIFELKSKHSVAKMELWCQNRSISYELDTETKVTYTGSRGRDANITLLPTKG